MKKLAQFVSRLYPGAWRERYGAEFNALLDDLTLSWRDVFDIFVGGLIMRITRSEAALITVVAGVCGALLGGIAGWRVPPRFESSGVIRIQMWSPSPALAAGAAERLANTAFRPDKLKPLIEEFNLYPELRSERPLADVLRQMRQDIHVEPRSGTTFQVTFAYPDREKAHQVTLRLMEHLDEANLAELSRTDGPKSSDDWKSASVERVLALPNPLESTGLIDVRGGAISPSPAALVGQRLGAIAFSRESLKQLIESQDLYREDRAKQPLDVVIRRIRQNIRIEPLSSTALRVSFVYPDRHKAQQVVLELMEFLLKANLTQRTVSEDWKPEFTVRITPDDLPNLARAAANLRRIISMAAGLGGGLVLGLTVSGLRRRWAESA